MNDRLSADIAHHKGEVKSKILILAAAICEKLIFQQESLFAILRRLQQSAWHTFSGKLATRKLKQGYFAHCCPVREASTFPVWDPMQHTPHKALGNPVRLPEHRRCGESNLQLQTISHQRSQQANHKATASTAQG